MIEARTDAGGRTTIVVHGKFNFACYEEFQRVVGAEARPAYTIDLSHVTYIDSAALGMLLLLRERVNEDPKRVAIIGGTGQPADVLRLANFSSLFTMS